MLSLLFSLGGKYKVKCREVEMCVVFNKEGVDIDLFLVFLLWS